MAVNGNIIKQLRKEAGLTQGELGKKLGVVKQTISSWENNVSEPNSETLSELSKLFGVSVAQLYDHGVPNIDYANFKMDTPEFVLDFKMRIRDLMEEQKMSEDEFAQRVGFHKEEKDAYLYGNKMPSIEDLIKIAGALNVSTDYLLNISSRKRISSQEESLLQKFNRQLQLVSMANTQTKKKNHFLRVVPKEKGLKKNNRTIGGILWYGLQLGPTLLSASCLDGLGFINLEKRRLVWVFFTYAHLDCFVSDGLLTASGTCWPQYTENAFRVTDQCRFPQTHRCQLCHQM